ncbi:xanthine dehydrogenase molybdopterin binding subunit [Cobetia sp. 10Alg 146]|uniref:xanthine dehydrogenase molybdopterin binding subunit n=1 Tax=Cobetia sp. 10Alg 146 TaxID=3040019 RepID=UPI00244A4AC3|nr:xanthine dehydrogenase molybdopterin binding subunit [Cobetia sp. 10Alg 146]MDH2291264.1 xanthine dehydrogenase molybdopterin binding subunit [Cobetia sp. 10Alg 146]
MRTLHSLESDPSATPATNASPSHQHESAERHVSGTARYVDDLPLPAGTLHLAIGMSEVAHATLDSLALDAVRAAPGVVCVLSASDIPGHRDVGPVFPGDPLLVSDRISHHGQALFVVAAESERAARQAARLAKVAVTPLPLTLDPCQAASRGDLVRPTHTQARLANGRAATRESVSERLARSAWQLDGELESGGQEHFYLESQAALALPGEDDEMLVHSSSQHPSEVQKLIAEVLGVPFHAITVETRRMGGGFGGKETQAAPVACLAALMARRTGRAARLRLPRNDDMRLTGKRHPFHHRYQFGVDDSGRIDTAIIELTGDCGHSPDLSDAIVDRAMFHADNAYYLGNAHVRGIRARTNVASNTAFRGFGGPQGMLAIEAAMEDIARRLGRDPLEIRKRNLYCEGRETTHYGQHVNQYPLLTTLIDQLEAQGDYWARRAEIRAFNAANPVVKKGLALTPVKFGISFTAKHLNQAGALVHVYTDGSVQVNHGGTEMGQGLHTKITQVAARELGLSVDRVRITATRTDKVPNTSPTAASSGADLNGMATRDACLRLKARLLDFAAEHLAQPRTSLSLDNGELHGPSGVLMTWGELIQAAYLERISLSEKGFYATPDIHYDRESGTGHPFYYYAFGAALCEVVVDTLSGEYRLESAEILHDVGDSLNPAIDIGQIEGGFVQGMGWLTTEELKWNEEGRLLTDGPATYKIPAISDVPDGAITVRLLEGHPNSAASIYRSKAVGEPPFMLAISVWAALRDALASLTDYRRAVRLDTPATPERVMLAAREQRDWQEQHATAGAEPTQVPS